ncbi:hypothetical protein EGJ23_02815 [Pseudomonas sp. o96-267]|nr:hypothetical protein EGJ23_02815 [Pseudomonas sp. o96-267]
MQRLSKEQLQVLMLDSSVLEQDGLGPKVLRLQDSSFLKLFRTRRLFSSETLKPYAKRFADNARQLQNLGFIAPQIIEVYRVEDEVNGTAVHYWPLPGETLRQALEQAQPEQRCLLINQFGQLLARLHEKGVYFRSIHLGNVLVMPNGHLGLIDVADMKFGRRPLNLSMRQRNLKHMRRYKQDEDWLFKLHKYALSDGYRQYAPRLAQALLPRAE